MTPEAPPPTVSLTTAFEYAHSFGALAPYFAALTQCRAAATRCLRCARVWFPPRIICACGAATEWTELSGSGTVEAITAGPGRVPLSSVSGELVFALVRFDGAHNLALVRCQAIGTPRAGMRGRLVKATDRGPHPVAAAVFQTTAMPSST